MKNICDVRATVSKEKRMFIKGLMKDLFMSFYVFLAGHSNVVSRLDFNEMKRDNPRSSSFLYGYVNLF